MEMNLIINQGSLVVTQSLIGTGGPSLVIVNVQYLFEILPTFTALPETQVNIQNSQAAQLSKEVLSLGFGPTFGTFNGLSTVNNLSSEPIYFEWQLKSGENGKQ